MTDFCLPESVSTAAAQQDLVTALFGVLLLRMSDSLSKAVFGTFHTMLTIDWKTLPIKEVTPPVLHGRCSWYYLMVPAPGCHMLS